VTQPKILRVLQEGEFERLGGTKTLKVDVRIVTASNQDLAVLVKEKRFREDLFYRLNVIAVTAPPLREKREDVAVLAQHFLRVYAAKNNRTLAGFSDDALRCLEGYAWPGNVRELENVVERAVVLARGNTVEVGDLPDKITENAIVLERPAPGETAGDGGGEGMLRIRVGTPLAEVEQRMLEETLRMTRGNKTLTAKLLGIDPKTVFRKLKAAEDEEAGSGEPGGTERPGA